MIFLIIYLLSIPSCYILTKVGNKYVGLYKEWTIGERNCLILCSFIPFLSTLIACISAVIIVMNSIRNCDLFLNNEKANW